MTDWLERILENFEVVFWILIVFGSSLASWLRQRKKAQSRTGPGGRPARPARPAGAGQEAPPRERQVLLEPVERGRRKLKELASESEPEQELEPPFEEWVLRDDLESQIPVLIEEEAAPVVLTQEPPPLRRLPASPGAEELGTLSGERLEFTAGEATFGEASFVDELERRFSGTGSLEAELEERKLGQLEQQDTAATLERSEAWQPSASWREAIILREIFGPPKATQDDDLPAFRI